MTPAERVAFLKRTAEQTGRGPADLWPLIEMELYVAGVRAAQAERERLAAAFEARAAAADAKAGDESLLAAQLVFGVADGLREAAKIARGAERGT